MLSPSSGLRPLTVHLCRPIFFVFAETPDHAFVEMNQLWHGQTRMQLCHSVPSPPADCFSHLDVPGPHLLHCRGQSIWVAGVNQDSRLAISDQLFETGTFCRDDNLTQTHGLKA